MIIVTCRVYPKESDVLVHIEKTMCFENSKDLKNYLVNKEVNVIVDKVFEIKEENNGQENA